MESWCTTEDILNFAIVEEEKAEAFYLELAETMGGAMKPIFETFAQEERGHRQKLEDVKNGKIFTLSTEEVQDLHIADYVVDLEPKPGMTYEDALIVAMKREKAAFKLYNGLAKLAKDDAVKNLLLGIAQEEAKHKLRFEIEYDDIIG